MGSAGLARKVSGCRTLQPGRQRFVLSPVATGSSQMIWFRSPHKRFRKINVVEIRPSRERGQINHLDNCHAVSLGYEWALGSVEPGALSPLPGALENHLGSF